MYHQTSFHSACYFTALSVMCQPLYPMRLANCTLLVACIFAAHSRGLRRSSPMSEVCEPRYLARSVSTHG